MKNILKYIFLPAVGFLASCSYEFPVNEIIEPTSGEANFASTIVIGDGIAAGFMDGALYDRGQSNSFAVQMTNQMKSLGGGNFNLPLINSVNGFYAIGPGNSILGRLILKTVNGVTSPAPIGPGDLPGPFSGNKAELNNFSIPGLTLGLALIPQTGGPNVPQNPAFNPYYARFASNPASQPPLGMQRLHLEPMAHSLLSGWEVAMFWVMRWVELPIRRS
ncbi:hypothetical protein [Algoriphagus boritolerans]|uniref:hypothetical protein n=1 Tax=Algoriphagus boritolerans TaxID=308111 RepID=UPI000B30487B